MLKFSTGRSKPGWGKAECRPMWWPMDVPWANVRSDVRTTEQKKKVGPIDWSKRKSLLIDLKQVVLFIGQRQVGLLIGLNQTGLLIGPNRQLSHYKLYGVVECKLNLYHCVLYVFCVAPYHGNT